MAKQNQKKYFKKNKQSKNIEPQTFNDADLESLIKRREQIRNEYEEFLAYQKYKLEKEIEHYKQLFNGK